MVALAWLIALPLAAQGIPLPLRDWQGWVLHDAPEQSCPLSTGSGAGNQHQCLWPGLLTLDATPTGARFALQVRVDATSWVDLPGGERHWPQQVSVDGQAQPVLQHRNRPMLRLPPGDYVVRGELPWSARPATIEVPASIGRVQLSLDGQTVARVERNGASLTLGEASAGQRAADALSVRVYRRLQDGLPPQLDTQLQLDVAGSAREQSLGPALPPGFVATALDGDLPARLDADGTLRVQLRPGRWMLNLHARGTQPLAKVNLILPASPWPQQEVWSYADDTDLRGTRVEGVATDASQAGVPDDWADLPAFRLDKADGLTVTQAQRGDDGGAGNGFTLQRQLWLDFDGHGFSVADHLVGSLKHRQRLDVAAPWQLQSATLDRDQPPLITRSATGGDGVEVRGRVVNLDADLRLPRSSGALPVSGWQLPLDSIDATLHLAPGSLLLGAPGADGSPDSWVARWSLLDLFVVAVIALLAGRLLGWRWALLAALFFALAQHQAGTPRLTLAAAFALALLMGALPEGKLRRAARIGAVVFFAIAVLRTLPFAATQLKYALHPQLESGRTAPFASMQAKARDEVHVQYIQPPGAAPPPPPMPAPPPLASISASGSARYASSNSASSASLAQQVDRHSVIQAGSGTPTWHFGNDYRLRWSGPVSSTQTMRLLMRRRGWCGCCAC